MSALGCPANLVFQTGCHLGAEHGQAQLQPGTWVSFRTEATEDSRKAQEHIKIGEEAGLDERGASQEWSLSMAER